MCEVLGLISTTGDKEEKGRKEGASQFAFVYKASWRKFG
jgi:hypothetical protein